MAVSVFEIFKIGIGPSSSHTVGPMRAALRFAVALQDGTSLDQVNKLTVDLYGSLGATGKGHGTNKAVLLGLEGELPEQIDPDCIPARLEKIRQSGKIQLLNRIPVRFNETEHLLFHRKALPYHSNGMRFTAYDQMGRVVLQKDFYSVGGGFVVSEAVAAADHLSNDDTCLPFPFNTGDGLLEL